MSELDATPPKRVTMRDVARAAGVSPATVSFVVNDVAGQTISPATRERVLQTAATLGYRAHPLARALREGSSRLVVLDVGPLPRASVLESLVDGMDEELAAAGFGMLVSFGTGRAAMTAATDAIHPHAVVNLAARFAADASDPARPGGIAVHFDTQMAYLRERGAREIAVAVPTDADSFFHGVGALAREAAARAGMTASVLTPADVQAERALPEAIAAVSDGVALEVLAALADRGLRAPDDVAVIGFGDAPEASLWRPALTSVQIDARDYGRRIARHALGLADEKPAADVSRVIARTTA